MALDLYEFCPGGTEKKIKFCACAKDSLNELDKVDDAMKGGQRAAALSQLNRLLQSKGNRPCYLALKGVAQLELGDTDGYIATAKTFLEAHPQNSAALAMSAVAAGAKGELKEGIALLQRGLQQAGENVHANLYYAIGFLSDVSLRAGFVLAARGHGALQLAWAPDGDTHPLERQLRLFQAPNVPLLLKEWFQLLPCPDGATWKGEFDAALDAVNRGCWQPAVDLLQPLAVRQPQEPAILKALAVLLGWLACEEETAAAWHRYAALPGVDFDEAVQAEALAQMLSSVADENVVEEVVQTYPVADTDRVMERLLSEKHLSNMPVDRAAMAREGKPPPRGAFWLLDRPMPTTGQGLKVEDVPNVLGELYLYGRETDREARLEFVVAKTPDLADKVAAVEGLLGEFGGPAHKEERTGEMSAGQLALSWRWRLPNDVPTAEREVLLEAKRRDVNLNVWPTTPMPELDGKCPQEAAADPAYRIRVAAAILLLELSAEQARSPFDYNALREKLGLPVRRDLPQVTDDLSQLPLFQLHLVAPERLSDENLQMAYARAVMHLAPRAIRRLGAAMLERPEARGDSSRAEIHGVLATVAPNTEEAAACYRRAYEAAVADGQPAGRWAVHELYVRAIRGEGEEFGRLLTLIQSRHIREPNVDRMLYSVLVRIGAITPDGKPVRPQAADAGPISDSQSAAAPEAIWTPDRATPPPGEDRPRLIIPGS
jgi:tetratricopeptide (TPR) repeat protein